MRARSPGSSGICCEGSDEVRLTRLPGAWIRWNRADRWVPADSKSFPAFLWSLVSTIALPKLLRRCVVLCRACALLPCAVSFRRCSACRATTGELRDRRLRNGPQAAGKMSDVARFERMQSVARFVSPRGCVAVPRRVLSAVPKRCCFGPFTTGFARIRPVVTGPASVSHCCFGWQSCRVTEGFGSKRSRWRKKRDRA